MKERIQGIIIGIILTVFLVGTISFATQHSDYVERFYRDIKITLNGLILEPKDVSGKEVEPFIIDGTTYLPVRAISEALNLKVNWNDETNTVELIDEKTSDGSRMLEGDNSEKKNDDATKTDAKEPFMRIGDKEYFIDSNTSTSNKSNVSSSDTSVAIGGGQLTGAPTEMQKKALKDAQDVLNNNYYGYSKENLKSYLGGKYINSEVMYAMDNVDANWNEQALKTANVLKSMCGTKKSTRSTLKLYKYTDEEIEYVISHFEDYYKRNAAKYANSYDPDYEHIKFDGSTIIYYKMTFEEYMQQAGYEDEEIAFAREELKYKQ